MQTVFFFTLLKQNKDLREYIWSLSALVPLLKAIVAQKSGLMGIGVIILHHFHKKV